MAKTLVLAVKPSVGREIGRVLGCGAAATASWRGSLRGHLGAGPSGGAGRPEVYDKAWEKWDMLTPAHAA